MAGRPKKNNEVKKEVKTKKVKKNELSTEELIAQAVQEALRKQELEFNKKLNETLNEKPKTQKKIKPSQKKISRKFVPDNTKVMIQQNIGGKFIISERKGSNFYIELNGYGDATPIAFKDLKNYHGRHNSFLRTGALIIVDVISEDESITIEDVVQDLNLQKIYDDDSRINPIDIEYYLIDEDLEEFKTKIRNSLDLRDTILEVAYVLFRQGRFTNNEKMNVIREVFAKPQLFTD